MNVYYLLDGANRTMVNLLKIKFNESLNWDSKRANPESMKVIPFNFATEHKQMLSKLHVMITEKHLVIPEEHQKLIISLRTAYAKELSLDKEQTSNILIGKYVIHYDYCHSDNYSRDNYGNSPNLFFTQSGSKIMRQDLI